MLIVGSKVVIIQQETWKILCFFNSESFELRESFQTPYCSGFLASLFASRQPNEQENKVGSLMNKIKFANHLPESLHLILIDSRAVIVTTICFDWLLLFQTFQICFEFKIIRRFSSFNWRIFTGRTNESWQLSHDVTRSSIVQSLYKTQWSYICIWIVESEFTKRRRFKLPNQNSEFVLEFKNFKV